MTPSIIVLAAIAIFAIVLVSKGIRIVRQAQTMVVERLGRYHKTLTSGVNLILPILDRPREIDWRFSSMTPAGDVTLITIPCPRASIPGSTFWVI